MKKPASITDSGLDLEIELPSQGVTQFIVRNRLLVLVAIHILVFTSVYPLAYYLRFDGVLPEKDVETLWWSLPWVVAVKLAVFMMMRSHRGWWRYATFTDMVKLAEATSLSTVILVALGYLDRYDNLSTPRLVVVLDWAGTLLVLGGLRFSTRLFRERYYPMIASKNLKQVLVVSASEAGLCLVRTIHTQRHLGLKVVGLLDADRALSGRTLGGVEVLGTTDELGRCVLEHKVETVLVPTPAVGPRQIRPWSVLATTSASGFRLCPVSTPCSAVGERSAS